MINYYKVLDTTEKECTTLAILKQVFKDKVKIVHPDKGGTTKQFQDVKRAYDALKPIVLIEQASNDVLNFDF